MKKLTLIFSVCMAVLFLSRFSGQATEPVDAKVYFVDRYIHCLIGVPFKVENGSKKTQADAVIGMLCASQENDADFISYSAGFGEDITVSLKGETAYLDLSKNFAEAIPDDRTNQELFIYQLVNSVCSLPDIEYVRFTVAGKKDSGLFKFFDGEEVFSPNFDI